MDGTVLLTERNKAAIAALKNALTNNKKDIAIFYGAAHMPDMEERLMKEYGLKRQGSHWLTAWEMKLDDDRLQELFSLPRKGK